MAERGEARRAVGSWLDGPVQFTREPGDYPGRRLGLSASGPGSIARFGRRFVALLLDWFLALLVARGLFGPNEWAPLGVFAVVQAALVGTLGGGVGHLALHLRVVRLDGTPAGPMRAVGRAVLLSLAIPALIWDRDQRGLHDRFMGTVLRRV
jgi:hypothetical protein